MLKRRTINRHGAGAVMLAVDLIMMVLVTVAFGAYGLPVLIFAAITLIVLYGKGMYRSKAHLSALDDFPSIFAAAAIGAAFGFAVALDIVDTFALVTIGLFVSYVIALGVGRVISYFIIHRVRRAGHFQRRVAIIGTGVVADRIIAAAAEDPQYGFDVIGCVDKPGPDGLPNNGDYHMLGSPDDINQIIIDHYIDYVIVAFTNMPESELVGIIRTADRRSCEISAVGRFFEISPRNPSADEIGGMSLELLQRRAYRTLQWRTKRAIDIVVSACALLILSPLMITVAVISRVTDGPGIIFRQQRISLDGEPFEIMKFRSLRPANDAESQTKWNVKNDDRMSAFGKFIRKTSIDELPQLFNILNGDMSLVGPRPERPHFVQEFSDEYRHYDDRHRVPSGLTGWAQVNGLRGDTSIEDRARYDNYYIQNWSLWFDFKIMLRTTLSLTKAAG